MTTTEDIRSGAPYYDDFDATKNYHQSVFVPDRAVQARELTGLQSQIRHQIGVHARAIYKDGTQVIGGLLVPKKIIYNKIDSDFGGFPVLVDEFEGQVVEELDSSNVPTGLEGTVIEVRDDGIQKALFLDIDIPLEAGNKLRIKGQSVYATITESGNCFYLGLNAGEFFYENTFISVPRQGIVLEDYNSTPTGTAGLVWSTSVVTASEDSSLFDPARGTTNFGSPGADRIQTIGTLVYVKEGDPLPDDYSPLYEIREGGTKTESSTTIYSDLAKELARRTNDESGNYTVNPFQLTLEEGIWNRIRSVSTTGVIETYIPIDVPATGKITISGNSSYAGDYDILEIVDATHFRTSFTPATNLTDTLGLIFRIESKFSITLGKGKAYVRGFEIEKIGTTQVPVDRARETQKVQNYNIVPIIGNYVIVDTLTGNLPVGTSVQSVNFYSAAGGTGTLIGTGQASYIRYQSGVKGDPAAKYRLYFLSISMNSGQAFESVRSVKTGGGFMANVAADSIVSGKTILNSSGSTSLLYPIPQEGVSTLQPGGVSSTSWSRLQQFTGAATGNSVQFSLGGGSNSTFYGPVGANFAGTDIELTLYHFVNTSTGQVLNVTDLQISNGGLTLTATFDAAGGNVSAVIPVQLQSTSPKTKTITAGSTTAASTALDATDTITLAHRDIKTLKTILKGTVDVTDRFTWDSGQTDLTYEFGSVKLRPGQILPATGGFTITYDYYAHSGTGYFSVDSYPEDRSGIPSYRFKSTGVSIDLADAIDFRIVGSGIVPVPNIPISSDYEFYLPRIDAVVLYSTGEFGIIRGIPAQNPLTPKVPETTMALYYLAIPPYTKNGTDVQTTYKDNKRYTMEMVGVLDKRIGRLEYYTSLSLLEMDTKNSPIYDEAGLERFKNGFLVDSFTGHGVGNVYSADYKCSIDENDNYCRPMFKMDSAKMSVLSQTGLQSNTASKDRIGEIFTLPYTEEAFLFNNIATRFESVTPFLVTKRTGELFLNPPSDDWMDTTSLPALAVNLSGDADNWEAMLGEDAYSSVWGSWETVWSGTTRTRSGNTTTTTTTRNQERTGTITQKTSEVIEESIGDYVRNVNIIPNMRAISIHVIGQALRPNRDLYVFFEDDNVGGYVTPESGYTPVTEGVVRSNSSGEVKFTLDIPGGVYRTGDRIITVTDDPQNILDNASTYSKTTFYSSGLNVTTQESVISTRVPKITTTTVTESRTLTNVSRTSTVNRTNDHTSGRGDASSRGQSDPIAQSFFISSEAYPSGFFASSVDIFIRSKPSDNVPLVVQLRPMVNGYPHSWDVIPFSNVIVPPSQINTPTNSASLDSILSASTNVKFDAPVYLEPGKEYAVVMLSDSLEYETYVATMGQKILGTDTTVISQISLGSMFKSQAGTTWTAYQNDDIMLRLNKAKFSTEEGTLTLQNLAQARKKVNLFNHNTSPIQFAGVAEITPTYQIKRSNTGVLSNPASYFLKSDTPMIEECYYESAGDFRSILKFNTTNSDVSPLFDTTRNSLIAVENIVNNQGLLRTGLTITAPGSGYDQGTTTISVTGDTGTGAVLQPVITGGQLTDVIVVDPGQGYTTTPIITVSGSPGTGATINYFGGFETSPQNGNSLAKYITRNINLAEGFEATYLTVQFDANQVEGTEIQVFYRAKSSEDPDIIDNKDWVPMKRNSNTPLISGDDKTFTETTWQPSTLTLEYTSGGNTYTSASIIAVKVVFLSNNTARVPKIRQFRAITSV